MKKVSLKTALSLSLVLLFVVSLFTGCAAGAEISPAYRMDGNKANFDADLSPAGANGWNEYAKESPSDTYEPETTPSEEPVSVQTGRKIIKTVSLDMQTMNFEQTVSNLELWIKSVGGYIEDSRISGTDIGYRGTIQRTASYTFRVPADKVDEFANGISKDVNVISRRENSNDITDSYYDVQAHIDSLTIQEERLLEMLKKADELQYMLELERELASVRYHIESLTSQIRRYDSLVSFSTVTVSLSEVVKYEELIEQPRSFGEEVGNAFAGMWESFVEGCRAFVIWLIYALPAIVILALIVLAIILLVKILRRRSIKKRRMAQEQMMKMQQQQAQQPPLPADADASSRS